MEDWLEGWQVRLTTPGLSLNGFCAVDLSSWWKKIRSLYRSEGEESLNHAATIAPMGGVWLPSRAIRQGMLSRQKAGFLKRGLFQLGALGGSCIFQDTFLGVSAYGP